MSGNKEIVDLSLIASPLNADLYCVQGGDDWRIRIGAAGGLPYLGADGLVPVSLLPATGTASWGYITGTLADQTDLAEALSSVDVLTVNALKTLALTDAGVLQYMTASATLTVPSNSAVAFPVGTVIPVLNNSGSSLSIGRTVGVNLYIAGGDGSSGVKTLANHGMVNLLKVATDTWFIVGTGIS